MKKLVSLILLLSLSLLAFAACGKTDGDDEKPPVTRIGYFPGTTGIGMAKMINDADPAYSFTKFNSPAEIMAKLVTGEIDIAAYPTNGVPALNAKIEGGVQYLAVNTLGVLYLCTNGVSIEKLSDLEGKTVYVPEQAPKLVLEYILKKNNISVTFSQSSLDLLPNQIVSGENGVQIALLPEPKVTVAKVSAASKGVDSFAISPVDLNAEWNQVSGNIPMVQGCLVVRAAYARDHATAIERFLTAYEASISYIKNTSGSDNGGAAQMVVDAGILPKVPIAKQAIPRSNITYMVGDDMKAAVLGFLEALSATYPADGFYKPAK